MSYSINEVRMLSLIATELKETNYTILSDYAGSNQQEWITYRAALRALTNDPNWPDVDFPTRPQEPPFPLE